MATLTQSQMADRACEALGVKNPVDSLSAEDSNRAQEAVLSAWYRLRKEGLAPFAVSAVPEWAQTAMAHIVAQDLMAVFGVSGERAQLIMQLAQQGRVELARGAQGKKLPVRVEFDEF
jgi:hypothetical protein